MMKRGWLSLHDPNFEKPCQHVDERGRQCGKPAVYHSIQAGENCGLACLFHAQELATKDESIQEGVEQP